MADEGNEAGPSNPLDDSLDGSLDFTSESFDPVRALYSQNLGLADENAEIFSSVEHFERTVSVESYSHVSSACSVSCLPSRVPFETEPQAHGPEQASSCLVEANIGEELDCEPIHDVKNVLAQHVARSQLTSNSDVEMRGSLGVSSHGVLETEAVTSVQESEELEESIQSEPASDSFGRKLDSCMSRESTNTNAEMVCEGTQESGTDNTETTDKDANTADVNKKTTQTRRRDMTRRTILTEMETGYLEGPLSILRRSVQERLKVRVVTRSVRNVRGISTGYVIAFDKHMNMAMIDVDEVYRKPVGKHQKKVKKVQKKADADTQEAPQDVQETEPVYPKTPWQPVGPGGDGNQGASLASVLQTSMTQTVTTSQVDHRMASEIFPQLLAACTCLVKAKQHICWE